MTKMTDEELDFLFVLGDAACEIVDFQRKNFDKMPALGEDDFCMEVGYRLVEKIQQLKGEHNALLHLRSVT